MPTYEILYQSSTANPATGTGTTVEVHLVQDSIAKHPDTGSGSEYVDYVNIDHEPCSTDEVVVKLRDLDFSPGDIDRIVSEGSVRIAAEHLSTIKNDDDNAWEVRFSAPLDSPSTATFYFGSGAPPEKIKVKIKKQGDTSSCP
ncbi:MAG: hypothetical protein R6X02_02440 [Enhygromyxa sp.]